MSKNMWILILCIVLNTIVATSARKKPKWPPLTTSKPKLPTVFHWKEVKPARQETITTTAIPIELSKLKISSRENQDGGECENRDENIVELDAEEYEKDKIDQINKTKVEETKDDSNKAEDVKEFEKDEQDEINKTKGEETVDNSNKTERNGTVVKTEPFIRPLRTFIPIFRPRTPKPVETVENTPESKSINFTIVKKPKENNDFVLQYLKNRDSKSALNIFGSKDAIENNNIQIIPIKTMPSNESDSHEKTVQSKPNLPLNSALFNVFHQKTDKEPLGFLANLLAPKNANSVKFELLNQAPFSWFPQNTELLNSEQENASSKNILPENSISKNTVPVKFVPSNSIPLNLFPQNAIVEIKTDLENNYSKNTVTGKHNFVNFVPSNALSQNTAKAPSNENLEKNYPKNIPSASPESIKFVHSNTDPLNMFAQNTPTAPLNTDFENNYSKNKVTGNPLENPVPLKFIPSNTIPLNFLPSGSIPANSIPQNTLNAIPSKALPRNTSPLCAIPSNTIPQNQTPQNLCPPNTNPSKISPSNTNPLNAFSITTGCCEELKKCSDGCNKADLVLYKPEDVSIMDVQGDIVKKVTMTVLVPMYVSKLDL